MQPRTQKNQSFRLLHQSRQNIRRQSINRKNMRDAIFRHLLPFPVPDSGIMDYAVEWSGFVCGRSEIFGLGYAGEVTD
jgi:hypothetical protein